jgi:hypothetical protein
MFALPHSALYRWARYIAPQRGACLCNANQPRAGYIPPQRGGLSLHGLPRQGAVEFEMALGNGWPGESGGEVAASFGKPGS